MLRTVPGTPACLLALAALAVLAALVLAGCDAAEDPDAPAPDDDPADEAEEAEADEAPDGDDAAPEDAEDPDAPAFAEDPDCFGVELAGLAEASVTCGTVEVPLDHDEPEGDTIALAVAVLAGSEDDAGPPTLVLGGGPGEVMVETALTEPEVQETYLGEQDAILVDQRGVGHSDPALDCPELDDEEAEAGLDDLDESLDALEGCRTDLAEDGVDLDAFNHVANADDVDAVRRALDHDEVDLRGTSYGTHLALHAAARNPDGVRSLVLSSPIDPSQNYLDTMAPGFQASLDRVIEACEDTPGCSQQVGDLEAAIDEVVARLDDAPEEVTVEPPGGEETTDTYDANAFVAGLFTLFYLPDGAYALPALVDDAQAGDLEPLAEIVALVEQQLEGLTTPGMQFSMVCSGEAPGFDLDAARAGVTSDVIAEHWLPISAVGGEATDEACERWDVEQAYDPEAFSYATDIPALVVTGELDHVTPPELGAQVADALDTAHLVEVPGVGHGPLQALDLFVTGCGDALVEEFLDDPERPPEAACVDQMPPFQPLGELPDQPEGP